MVGCCLMPSAIPLPHPLHCSRSLFTLHPTPSRHRRLPPCDHCRRRHRPPPCLCCSRRWLPVDCCFTAPLLAPTVLHLHALVVHPSCDCRRGGRREGKAGCIRLPFSQRWSQHSFSAVWCFALHCWWHVSKRHLGPRPLMANRGGGLRAGGVLVFVLTSASFSLPATETNAPLKRGPRYSCGQSWW
jgi:hypothetical protein